MLNGPENRSELNPARSTAYAPPAAPSIRPSSPEAGRSLFKTVYEAGAPVRAAAHKLIVGSKHQASDIKKIMEPISLHPDFGGDYETASGRAAWFLTNIVLLWRIAGSRTDSQKVCVEHPISWFFGTEDDLASRLLNNFDLEAVTESFDLLNSIEIDDSLIDLLPYIIEPHDPASRLTVKRDTNTSIARKAKRESGVFYTPSDVSEFMVRQVWPEATATWLDPACGTGVFLKAALQCSPTLSVFSVHGIDVSALSVESCVFCLMSTFSDRCPIDDSSSPYRCWLAIRMNFAVGNTLHLRGPDSAKQNSKIWSKLRTAIMSGAPFTSIPQTRLNRLTGCQLSLTTVFPEVGKGFDRVIMNPPYTNDCGSVATLQNWDSYASVKKDSLAKTYLAFVEMMKRFSKPAGSAAAVLPLSIAVNQDRQTRACRESLIQSGDDWTALFFDREPHALFGEDVKTRNTILVYHGGNRVTRVRTSSLRKWRSDKRIQIFKSINTVQISPHNIGEGIPKLGSVEERDAYEKLSQFRNSRPFVEVCGGENLLSISQRTEDTSLYVAGTAYNFLNAFFSLPDASELKGAFSSSKASHIRAQSTRDAFAAYAVIVSRLSFWLWRVEGDGFHVNRGFLDRLPLLRLPFSEEHIERLSDAGERIWDVAQSNRTFNVNGGRTTVSHQPPLDLPASEIAESILLSEAGIETEFGTHLSHITTVTTSASADVYSE